MMRLMIAANRALMMGFFALAMWTDYSEGDHLFHIGVLKRATLSVYKISQQGGRSG